MNNLRQETKIIHCSTQSSSGTIMNADENYKSIVQYTTDLNFDEDDIEMVQFSVPYAVIPCSFYNVDYHNNQLDIIKDGVASSHVFPSGNYYQSTFISTFKSLLPNFGITLNQTTQCFTITNSTHSFSLIGTSTIDFVMGFSDTLESSLVSSVNTIVMPRICNFFQLPRVNMKCHQFANSQLLGRGQTSNDVIISIPNDAPLNGKINYKNIGNLTTPLDIKHVQSFTIMFCDDNENHINFNGVSSYFGLQFDIYRKPRELNRMKIRDLFNQLNRIYPDDEEK